jgi:hypothetical protein
MPVLLAEVAGGKSDLVLIFSRAYTRTNAYWIRQVMLSLENEKWISP